MRRQTQGAYGGRPLCSNPAEIKLERYGHRGTFTRPTRRGRRCKIRFQLWPRVKPNEYHRNDDQNNADYVLVHFTITPYEDILLTF